MTITRRAFTSMALGATAAMALPKQSAFGFQSTQTVSSRGYPPLQVNFVPGVFQARHSDLGGVLDTRTGLIWGYEPFLAMVNTTINFSWVESMPTRYPQTVLNIANNDPSASRRALYASTYQIISQRTWRVPTVFEARDAVARGLFTFGTGRCNLYFKNPESVVAGTPGVNLGLANLRWTTSVTRTGLAHVFSPQDGGTLVTSRNNSFHSAFVVAQL